MRLAIGVIAVWCVVVVVIPRRAAATVVGGEPMVCPACGHKFSAAMVEGSTTVGGDEEGRPLCLGMDTQEFRLHDCPKCHYSGMMSDFDHPKVVPVGPVMQKVRDALAKNSATLPAGALWPLERVRAAEICYQADGATAYRFESLYRLGAWLADDAGEDDLAREYRKKAAEQLVLAAGLKGQPGADYVVGVREYWAGDFAKANVSLKSAGVGLGADTAELKRRWTPVRNAILLRLLRKNADPNTKPDTQPVGETDDKELDWDSVLEEAEPAERPLVFQRMVTLRMARNIETLQHIAEIGALGQAAAYKKATDGGIETQRNFVFAFGRRSDAATSEMIHKLIVVPQNISEQDSRWLMTLWEQIRPGDIASETRKPDMAQLIKDFNDSMGPDARGNAKGIAIDALARSESPRAAVTLLADLEAHPGSYTDYPVLSQSGELPWKTMALDAPRSIDVANRLLNSPKLAGWAVGLTLRPLAYCADAKSLEILHSALTNHDTAIRVDAAKCLIVRRRHEGTAGLISLAIEDDHVLPKLEPEIAAIFVSLITADDIAALQKLETRWPGPIQRKDDDTKAMAAVTVRAALARVDNTRFLADYDKAVDELLQSPITGNELARVPWEDTVPQSMEMLGWCGNLYCSPHVEKLLRPMLASGITEYGVATTIEMLARDRVENEDDVIAEQFNRPAPMMVKQALLQAEGRLHIKGQKAVIERWAKSAHTNLATAAQKALKPE